ncbi:hypothetical protein RJT34_11417 [Clitoria ternatea]|uniref:Homeobox domain-containing protein n=1 Tax=Clitoria ternatea TaxID=43366 RepID=A0AAN9JJW3_CLITE
MDQDGVSGFCMRKSSSSGSKYGRWNPTTEQLQLLTQLFKSGLRTPTIDQIQNISSQLSFYGKIQTKNVFYWFQNHKARERQKRRKLCVNHIIPTQNSINNTSTQSIGEMYQVSEPDSVVETLQLFPLNSSDRLRWHANECRDGDVMFSYTKGEGMEHPPLELRLSSL